MRRVCIVSLFVLLSLLNAADTPQPVAPTPAKTFGTAQLTRIVSLSDGFCFVCDIKDWPAVIGRDITIRIDGVVPPQIVADAGLPNKYYNKQLKDFLAASFASAGKKDIQLRHIRRADTFALIAQVIIDGKNLGDMLIAQGLAQPGQVNTVALQAPTVSNQPAPTPNAPVGSPATASTSARQQEEYYVASQSSDVYHKSTCHFVDRLKDDTKVIFKTKAEAEATGRRPCKSCNP